MMSFDEWFKAKHGMSFEEAHQQPMTLISDAMKALSLSLREYVSEMVAASTTASREGKE